MAFIAEVEFSIDIIIVIKGAEEQIFYINCFEFESKMDFCYELHHISK